MKNYRNFIVSTMLIFILVSSFFLYKPIQEGHIYQRDLKLTDETNDETNTSAEEKLIKRAKESFKDLLSIEIDETNLRSEVSFESTSSDFWYDTPIDIARVSFINENNELIYYITYDTLTGDVVELSSFLSDNDGGSVMQESELEKIAKNFFFSLNNVEESDIEYSGQIQRDIYVAEIILKKNYKTINLCLDSYKGNIVFYQSYQLR